MANPAARSSRPFTAALLSLFCVGLGHLYVGRIRLGLQLFLIWGIFVAHFGLLAATLRYSNVGIWVLLLTPIVAGAITIYAMVDSYRIARRTDDKPLEDYQRPAIYVLFLLFSCLFTLPASFLIRSNYLEAFYIPTDSMAPNVVNGDRILVSKSHSVTWVPHRGEVVVFRNPDDRKQAYVKRVVGLPLDQIEVKSGRVSINGTELSVAAARDVATDSNDEVMLETNDVTYSVLVKDDVQTADVENEDADHFVITVPKGHVFLLGDNRPRSKDSRYFGTVPLADVIGPVQFNYWPAKSWSRFGPF